MKKLLLLVAGLALLSGCASTLTSQDLTVGSQPATPLALGCDLRNVSTLDAVTLDPFKLDFYTVLTAESQGQVRNNDRAGLQLFVTLGYKPTFTQDDLIGVASLFLPFLSFIPDNSTEDFFVEYLLKDAQGFAVYQQTLRGKVEGNSKGFYIARINAANELRDKQAKYVAENAARMILNDLAANTPAILAAARRQPAVVDTAAPAPIPAPAPGAAPPRPGLPAVSADVDDIPAGAARSNPNAYAIVVGIERYRQQLPPADFAVHDAKTVAAYLTRNLGYPEENVVTLTDEHAALGDFVKYFERWLPNNVEAGGKVFVYYSGHGAPNPKTGDAFLVPYDADPSFINETGYSLKRMYTALGKLPAQEVVVALDSCFSGSGGRSVLAKGARSITLNLKETALPSRNMTVLAASSGDQMSSTYDDKGHGLFTYFLLKGIKNEDVVDKNGALRLDDLFAYLQPQVQRVARKQFNNEQTPQIFGRVSGQ